MQRDIAESDLYAGLAAPRRRFQPAPISTPAPTAATSKRSGTATGSWSAARPTSPEPLAYRVFTIGTQQILVLRDELATCAPSTTRAVIAARSSVAGSEGRLKGRLLQLPLPRLVLFAARRARPRAFEVAAGRVRQAPTTRSTPYRCRSGAASSSSISTRTRQRRRRQLRYRLRRPFELAARRARHRPCLQQGDELQLEDFLGKLQRVPALPDRAPASFRSRADLWPRADGPPRRPRLGAACRQ